MKSFEVSFKETFGDKTNIEKKELLYAFVQKSYDEYLNKIEYRKLIAKIDEV